MPTAASDGLPTAVSNPTEADISLRTSCSWGYPPWSHWPVSKGPWAHKGCSGSAHSCVRAYCSPCGPEYVLLLGRHVMSDFTICQCWWYWDWPEQQCVGRLALDWGEKQTCKMCLFTLASMTKVHTICNIKKKKKNLHRFIHNFVNKVMYTRTHRVHQMSRLTPTHNPLVHTASWVVNSISGCMHTRVQQYVQYESLSSHLSKFRDQSHLPPEAFDADTGGTECATGDSWQMLLIHRPPCRYIP